MSDTNTANDPANGQAAAQSDEADNNTEAGATGTETQTVNTEADEKKFTQADIDRIVAGRLQKAVKAELKKLANDDDQTQSVEGLQKQLSEAGETIRGFQAREDIRDFIADPKNGVAVRAENQRAVERLVIPELTYGDDGKAQNLKEALATVKTLAPALFGNVVPGVNAGESGVNNSNGFDMNAMIRQAAGRQ